VAVVEPFQLKKCEAEVPGLSLIFFFIFPTRKVAYCLLLTAYCLLLTAYCLLLTAYCLLLTAYCLLLTAYCLLPRPRKRGTLQNLPKLYAFVTIKGAGIGQNHVVTRR
jgi:hypothetical protein